MGISIIHYFLHTQFILPRKSNSSAGSLFPPVRLPKPVCHAVITVDTAQRGCQTTGNVPLDCTGNRTKRWLLFCRSWGPGLRLTQNGVPGADSQQQGCSNTGTQACSESSSTWKPLMVHMLGSHPDLLNQKLRGLLGGSGEFYKPSLWVTLSVRTTLLHVTCLLHLKPN